MSAQLQPALFFFRDLLSSDLDAIMAIEILAYSHPWTRSIFQDCLKVGYDARVLCDDNLRGYALCSVAVSECHLLNLTIDPAYQGLGLGRRLLREMMDRVTRQGVETLFLEVRYSNEVARRLYWSEGFNEIGCRRKYYPATRGRREDALVMAKTL